MDPFVRVRTSYAHVIMDNPILYSESIIVKTETSGLACEISSFAAMGCGQPAGAVGARSGIMDSVRRFAVLVALLALAAGQVVGQEALPVPSTDLTKPLLLSPERRKEFEAAMKARNYIRAETLLVEAINANPKSPELLKLAAGVFFLHGQNLNAAIAFKKAEKLEPLDDASRFTLAMAYVALERRDWARPELQKLAGARPENPLYIYWLARLDYDEQKFAAAVEKLNKAIALRPEFMKAHDNLGLNLEALGKHDEARKSYEEAIRLNRLQKPSSPWPPLNLAIMLLKLGKGEEAEPYLREALDYDPKMAEARYRLGTLLEKQGKNDEAIKELTEAAALDPDYPEPQYALARLYRQLGDPEKAQAALKEFQRRKSVRRKG